MSYSIFTVTFPEESFDGVEGQNSNGKSMTSFSKVIEEDRANNTVDNAEVSEDGLVSASGTTNSFNEKIEKPSQLDSGEKDPDGGDVEEALSTSAAADEEVVSKDNSKSEIANENGSSGEPGGGDELNNTKDVSADTDEVPEGEVPEGEVPQATVPEAKVPEAKLPEAQIETTAEVEEIPETDDYISPMSKHQLLKNILKKHRVKSSTWVNSIDGKTTMVTFVVESGRKEEDVLDELVSYGIGKEPGTSVSISPTTVCLSGELEKQNKTKKPAGAESKKPAGAESKKPAGAESKKPAGAGSIKPAGAESIKPSDADTLPSVKSDVALPSNVSTSTSAPEQALFMDSIDELRVGFAAEENGEGKPLMGEDLDGSGTDIQELEEGEFFKSIKARIIIQPIVSTLKRNAEFTFDYLAFVILASVISAVGLIEDNSVILVASMLISPLMGPILAATFGSAVQDPCLRNIGIKSEVIGLAICVLTGFVLGLPATYIVTSAEHWSSATDSWPSPEMYSRGLPRSLVTGAVIALVSGMAVALSVLGNNQGSLVGVAISASLLPPAVNCGLLWAHSLQSAIDSIGVTSSENVQYSGEGLNCTLISGNTYAPYFTCNIAQETFLLGLMSLILTLLNIGLIVVAAMFCLKVKQVSPRASVANEQVFWTKHMKVAKHYNTTVRPSTDYWATMVKDLKLNLQVTDKQAEQILAEGQNATHRTPYDLPEDLLRSHSLQDLRIRKRASSESDQSPSRAVNFSRVLSHDPKLESATFCKKPTKVYQGRFTVEKKRDSTQTNL